MEPAVQLVSGSLLGDRRFIPALSRIAWGFRIGFPNATDIELVRYSVYRDKLAYHSSRYLDAFVYPVGGRWSLLRVYMYRTESAPRRWLAFVPGHSKEKSCLLCQPLFFRVLSE